MRRKGHSDEDPGPAELTVRDMRDENLLVAIGELRKDVAGINARLDILNGKTARNVDEIEELKRDRAARDAVRKEREKEQNWARIRTLIYIGAAALGGALPQYAGGIWKALKP